MGNLVINEAKEQSKELIKILDKLTDLIIDKKIEKSQQQVKNKLNELKLTVECNEFVKGKRVHLVVYGLDKPLIIEMRHRKLRKESYTKFKRIDDSFYKVAIISHCRDIDIPMYDFHALLKVDAEGVTQGIYKIENKTNGKIYIGSSVDIIKRLESHRIKLIKNIHINSRLQKDWNTYGSNTFTFEILESVEKEMDLPIKEKEYIDKFSKRVEVYNWSNPMEESIKGRFKKTEIPKIKRNKNENNVNEIAIRKLNEKFGDKIEILHKNIEERKFYPKCSLDKWFIGNIDDQEILGNKKISAILNTWYCSNGFSIINTRIWASTFKRLYSKCISEYDYILVTPTMQKDLYDAKYRNRRR